MVTSKTLKACFLLWTFVAGNLSAASSTFQDETNPNASHPFLGSSPPPADHAVSYKNQENPPSRDNITPPPNWHKHHHAQTPPAKSDITLHASGDSNPTLPPPSGYQNAPPTSGGGGGAQPGSNPVAPVTPSTTPPSITPPVTGNTAPLPPSNPQTPFIGGTSDFWTKHHPFLADILKRWHDKVGGGNDTPWANMNLQEALSNTRTDGIGALYREGTASLLNSMVNKNFPFTTSDVRDSFSAALKSNKAAMAQAEVFKLANEGRLKQKV